MAIIKNVSISEDQARFVEEEGYSLSKILQNAIEKKMKKIGWKSKGDKSE